MRVYVRRPGKASSDQPTRGTDGLPGMPPTVPPFPQQVLDRHNARRLDPANAVLLAGQRTPLPTAYRSGVLLMPEATRRDGALQNINKLLTESGIYLDDSEISKDFRAESPRVWPVPLRQLRGAAPEPGGCLDGAADAAGRRSPGRPARRARPDRPDRPGPSDGRLGGGRRGQPALRCQLCRRGQWRGPLVDGSAKSGPLRRAGAGGPVAAGAGRPEGLRSAPGHRGHVGYRHRRAPLVHRWLPGRRRPDPERGNRELGCHRDARTAGDRQLGRRAGRSPNRWSGRWRHTSGTAPSSPACCASSPRQPRCGPHG